MRMDYPVDLRWYAYSPHWEGAGCLRGDSDGPMMIPSYEHLLCEDFARLHPDSADFLIDKLTDPNPYLAGYAFKCLIRVRPDLVAADLPPGVIGREDEVNFLPGGCVVRLTSLGEFVQGYFDQKESEEAEEDDA